MGIDSWFWYTQKMKQSWFYSLIELQLMFSVLTGPDVRNSAIDVSLRSKTSFSNTHVGTGAVW